MFASLMQQSVALWLQALRAPLCQGLPRRHLHLPGHLLDLVEARDG